jgi:hypothetical protein
MAIFEGAELKSASFGIGCRSRLVWLLASAAGSLARAEEGVLGFLSRIALTKGSPAAEVLSLLLAAHELSPKPTNGSLLPISWDRLVVRMVATALRIS